MGQSIVEYTTKYKKNIDVQFFWGNHTWLSTLFTLGDDAFDTALKIGKIQFSSSNKKVS